jgi:hypothetical protein
MSVIRFNSQQDKPLAFCMIDTTHLISDPWIKELTKNQADYTVSNLYLKGYTIFQGINEDQIIKAASENYDYACVFSTGTEFLNGDACFNELVKLCSDDFLIKGHILDRGDAYYELHQQCYLINLKIYRKLGFPNIGKQSLGEKHTQVLPNRSVENIHDSYTPLWINQGNSLKEYSHKCHGWNIIKTALEFNYVITAFDNNVRDNKKHLYPESSKDFYKHLDYVYYKERYCSTELVYKQHTENSNKRFSNVRQVIAPASGEWYKEYLSSTELCNVILYDYNLKSLEYWKQNVSIIPNVKYHFVHCDLLSNGYDFSKVIDSSLEYDTLINLSNIFCYEGTSTLSNLKYRLEKENEIVNYFKSILPNAHINFSARASSGFETEENYVNIAKYIKLYSLTDLIKPTWHYVDWEL